MLFLREAIEQREGQVLASYAVKSADSAGRVFSEPPDSYRTCFQRDRDRIIHSKAFRRLQEKTQVLLSSEGDHYRNRMIHSVECSQISRGLARTLGLNEDLAEAIALAHDLGHTPFGHAGEYAMNEMLREYGLHFEHNEQSLRIVEKLEPLNLSKEVLDGMLKHHTPYDQPKTQFVTSAHLEGQVVDLADEIAYTSADIDDGLRSEIFSIKDLEEVPLLQRLLEELALSGARDSDIFAHAKIASRVLHKMIKDVYQETQQRLQEFKIRTMKDVRQSQGVILRFSPEFRRELDHVHDFLMKRFYDSPKVKAQNDRGQAMIRKLFEMFYKKSSLLPQKMQDIIAAGEKKEIVVKDYIAGMTDSFAEKTLTEMAKSL